MNFMEIKKLKDCKRVLIDFTVIRFEINFEEKIIRPIKAEDDERNQNYYDECKEVWERRTIKEINEHAAYNMGQFLYRFANRNFSGMQMRPWYKMIDGAQIIE